MTPVDGFCLVGGLLKALGECWGCYREEGFTGRVTKYNSSLISHLKSISKVSLTVREADPALPWSSSTMENMIAVFEGLEK